MNEYYEGATTCWKLRGESQAANSNVICGRDTSHTYKRIPEVGEVHIKGGRDPPPPPEPSSGCALYFSEYMSDLFGIKPKMSIRS